MRPNDLKVSEVYDRFVKDLPGAPQQSTFHGWATIGTKFAAIAGTGQLFHFSFLTPTASLSNFIRIDLYAYDYSS